VKIRHGEHQSTQEQYKRNVHVIEQDDNDDDNYEELDDSDKDPDYLPRKKKAKYSGLFRQSRNLTRSTAKRTTVPSVSREVLGDSDKGPDDLLPKKKARYSGVFRQSRNLTRSTAKKSRVPNVSRVMGSACTSCKRSCSDKIDHERRTIIFKNFWDQDYLGRKNFVFYSVDRHSKKRKTVGDKSQRTYSFQYYLRDTDGKKHRVCKTFFLSTLGFDAKNDRFITTVMKTPKDAVCAQGTKRGKHVPANKINNELIKEHIMSFHPCISHYRRAHAPHRLYLPSDITVRKMYNDFKTTHPNFECCYQTYRKVVKSMNISFTKLGEEQCETCLLFEMSKHSHDHECNTEECAGEDGQQNVSVPDCEQCSAWKDHINRAHEARAHYRLEEQSQDTSVRSVDLQKVIMLPRIKGCKTVLFTKRLVVFHETFATVRSEVVHGVPKIKRKNISVIWHEGCAGRKADEIANTITVAVERERDMKHLIYWMDNCSSQNKNWCLFTTLVTVVNDQALAIEDITLKYFEAGHTFMSADSVHHGVEKAMQG